MKLFKICAENWPKQEIFSALAELRESILSTQKIWQKFWNFSKFAQEIGQNRGFLVLWQNSENNFCQPKNVTKFCQPKKMWKNFWNSFLPLQEILDLPC